MPPPNAVFPALFEALRGRLAASKAHSAKPTAKPPAHPVPTDALLTSLSASDASLQCCLDQEIRHDASANKLQLLRRKRLGVKKTLATKRRQKQLLDAVAAAECDAALLDASTHDQKFQLFMTETHAKAATRLQTLFFECIAEMKKALTRMESVAADTMEGSESMVDELLRCYEWQSFLTRLEQDCGGDIETSLLVPGSSHDRSSSTCPQRPPPTKCKASVNPVLQQVLKEHGPALENGESLVIRSMISVRRTTPGRLAPKKSSKSIPSLHFGVSVAEIWAEMLEDMMRAPNSTKHRTSISTSSSSTHRIRRLPQSLASSSESIPTFSTSGGMCSIIRRLPSGSTLQFPGTACDVALSSVYIGWMLDSEFGSRDSLPGDNTSGNDSWHRGEVADFSIYFDIAEYEQNFSAVMQNYAASAALDNASAPFPVDHAVLASARRSLREMNAILERTHGQKKAYSSDTIFAPRRMRDGEHNSRETTSMCSPNPIEGANSVFARASVLQLVQTLYYSKSFLTMLSPADVNTLRKLYPTTLFGEGCLSTLYVPVFSGARRCEMQQEEFVARMTPAAQVSMYPLSDRAIHELLLIYVARGRHTLTQEASPSVNCTQQLTSLALSDALSMLVPRPHANSNQSTDNRFSVIKNPQGLWREDKYAASEETQTLRDANAIFVECAVSSTPIGSSRQSITSLNTKTHPVLEMLSTPCMWRSCITSHEIQGDSNFCLWHGSVQRFLAVDESTQYIPNESRLKEAFITAESNPLADRTKRVILASSSLLEELSSRNLSYSIKTFFEHVVSAASNRAYQAEFLGATVLGKLADGDISMADLEQSHHELQRLVNLSQGILGTESRVTRELLKLLQLTVIPGVEDSFGQHSFFDLEELQSDIRTRDFDLLLRLSQQKLQILERLERRREDGDKLVARRLAPSISLPSMRFNATQEHAGVTDSELGSASVYDVIHVMRKGRQSLLRYQRQHAQDGGIGA